MMIIFHTHIYTSITRAAFVSYLLLFKFFEEGRVSLVVVRVHARRGLERVQARVVEVAAQELVRERLRPREVLG